MNDYFILYLKRLLAFLSFLWLQTYLLLLKTWAKAPNTCLQQTCPSMTPCSQYPRCWSAKRSVQQPQTDLQSKGPQDLHLPHQGRTNQQKPMRVHLVSLWVYFPSRWLWIWGLTSCQTLCPRRHISNHRWQSTRHHPSRKVHRHSRLRWLRVPVQHTQ